MLANGATDEATTDQTPSASTTSGSVLGRCAAVLYRYRDWVEPIALFWFVRLIGVLTVARFASLHGRSLGSVLSSWDGQWMLDIAEFGYDGVPLTQTDARGLRDANTPYAFFPGYPYLVGAVEKIPGFTAYGAAITVNVVVGALAAVGVARLAQLCAAHMLDPDSAGRWRRAVRMPTRLGRWLFPARDDDSAAAQTVGADPDLHRVGLIMVVLFAAAPMGIVLSMAYTEALFCALAAWALVGVLRGNWYLAGVTAFLSGFCRPTAAVLIAVVMLCGALAAWRLIRQGRYGESGPALFAVVFSPLGYIAYLCIVWAHTGSPTGWFTIQTQGWGTSFDWGRATYNFINSVLVSEAEIAPMVTAWVLLATFALVFVSLWKRLPWPVWLYGVLLVAQIAGSGGLMMSRPRLLLPAFVLLIPIAIGIARLKVSTQICILVAVIAVSSWFGAHMLTVYPHAI
ncbi:glycosyltransferase family 39 protein [Gordonia jinhuaensis]|uniref:Membrane protein n=1 Tax=Gordonia jinhuaensis TaxID=1517702 RepID=A0A916WYT0_9ACTN|nr:hypothetical protein [Gordonia jinhuaensis]GGB40624.1 membrane protein [Gordonia jinhuaensis]